MPDEFAKLLNVANARTLTLSRNDAEDLAAEHRREEHPATIRDIEEIATSEFWQQSTAGAASMNRLTKDELVKDTHHVRIPTIRTSKGAVATDVCFDGITGKTARRYRG